MICCKRIAGLVRLISFFSLNLNVNKEPEVGLQLIVDAWIDKKNDRPNSRLINCGIDIEIVNDFLID